MKPKRPYHKVIILILLSNFILFSSAFTVVNILIPSRFEFDARKTIENEICLLKNDLHSEQTYLSASVQFIYSNEQITNSEYFTEASYLKNYLDLQKVEKKEIIDFINDNELEIDTCYSYASENGNYLFAVIENFVHENDDSLFVIYINILPFIRYNFLWNILLSVLFIFISGCVILIGAQMNKSLEEAQESERRFFQNTSHELKTPLMAIQGYAEGIQAGIEDPAKGAKVILEENSRMTRLVEDFLHLSKLDSYHYKMNMIKADLREIAYDAMNMVSAAATTRNIELIPVIGEEPIFIRCDEEQMISAVFNILSNAVNYAVQKVTVICEKKHGTALITVSDDGKGIDEEVLSHIFDRFYTTKSGGTGIGLSISHEIVRLHKGEISAGNAEKGAVFVIKMPLYR